MNIIRPYLGALPSRAAILRGAANEWILLQQLEPYPKGTWNMTPGAIDLWVTAILTRANSEAEVFEYPPFTVTEAIKELEKRGYIAQPQEPPLTVRPEPPTVVAPPVDDTIPPRPEKSRFPWWLLILIAGALLMKGEKPKRRRKKTGLSGSSQLSVVSFQNSELKTENSKPKTETGLSGRLMNCGVWEEVPDPRTGGLKWSCMVYAPATPKKGASCAPGIFPKQKKVCIATLKVNYTRMNAGACS